MKRAKKSVAIAVFVATMACAMPVSAAIQVDRSDDGIVDRIVRIVRHLFAPVLARPLDDYPTPVKP